MTTSAKPFDATLYTWAYPDVILSGLEPKAHYECYGRLLGREPAPQVDQMLSVSTPDMLDLQYARGAIAAETPVIHNDLVSIIMPSYNNEAWIARAIHSALSQKGVKIELIVVDDGSTDGSVAIARKIAAEWPNMRIISLLRNFGCYYARNIGVLNSKGAWVTIIDSDDIVPQDRILRQMNVLKANPGKLACLGRLRRWNESFQIPLTELKYAENSLLWKREITDRIGYYDTVRFGGDTEFRMRIEATFGKDAVVRFPDELYFLRSVDGSLTTSGKSPAYKLAEGILKADLSQERTVYSERLAAWHQANKPALGSADNRMRLEFPLISRPFELGSARQNASPSLDQRRVGAMASFPPRRESLKATIANILPQIDELILYLNNYEDVPDFVNNPKIRVVRSQDAKGDLRDNGKFYDLPQTDDSYVFTFDDDLVYPQDYVARMIHQIEILGRSSVVGLHGVIFPDSDFNKLNQRRVSHFLHAKLGHFVDLLGTGTTAWHSSTLKVTLDEFTTTGLCDLWFAMATAKRNVPLYSIPRKKDWLTAYDTFEESLWEEAVSRPEEYFDVYNGHVAPVLQNGLVRHRMEAHLVRGYDAAALTSADIEILDYQAGTVSPLIASRKRHTVHQVLGCEQFRTALEPIHFHIIVNGSNCRNQVDTCLHSIAGQLPGAYSYEVTLIDDGSTDGTYEKLAASTLLPDAHLIHIQKNAGTARARHLGISAVPFSETIVILIELDDGLEPSTLRELSEHYQHNPECLLTLTSSDRQWAERSARAHKPTNGLDQGAIVQIEPTPGARPLAFRRKLYDTVQIKDLGGTGDKMAGTSADATLVGLLVEQCKPEQVTLTARPAYRNMRI